jgi:hypothetical protein
VALEEKWKINWQIRVLSNQTQDFAEGRRKAKSV